MQESIIQDLEELEDEPVLRDERGFPVERQVSGLQGWLMGLLEQVLCAHRDREGLRWHIQANDPVHYRVRGAGGRPAERVLLPDLYVVVGLDQQPPGPFRTWVDPAHQLTVAVEYGSRTSLRQDLGRKLALYRDVLRVPEYFVFDVDKVDLEGLLAGFRLDEGGDYRPIPPRSGPGEAVRLRSEGLGLELGVVHDASVRGGRSVRAFLPGSSEPLPIPLELEAARAKDEALRAKDEALRAKDAALRAKDAALATSQEEARAAAARIAELERRLGEQGAG